MLTVSVHSIGRGIAALLVAALLGVAATLTGAAPAAADHGCHVVRWPAFREIAPTARRIIVGTVIAPASDIPEIRDVDDMRRYGDWDPADSFRLRVDEVLRGSAPRSIEITRLRSGLPPKDPRPECDGLAAKVGDRIALALKGRLEGHRGRISTVAWIEGRPSISGQPAQRLTIGEVRRLAGHAADGTTLPTDRGIRRPTIRLSDLPTIFGEAIDDMRRTVGDVQARERCASILDELPDVPVHGPTTLVAGYGMDGRELATYAERLWWLGPMVEQESDGFTLPLDVCILDGSFTKSRTLRMLVVAQRSGAARWGLPICDKNEIPLDYDRPDPIPWPEATENWC